MFSQSMAVTINVGTSGKRKSATLSGNRLGMYLQVLIGMVGVAKSTCTNHVS